MTLQRELTSSEETVLKLLVTFDHSISLKNPTAVIKLSPLALSIMREKNIAKPLKVSFDGDKNLHNVILTINEFYKYINYCCKKVGFKILLDGSVETIDGLILSEEFLQ